MLKKKLSRGRQKIDMKPIKKEEARQVCFSKRRNGLFKKACELSTLCGAEICVVVFSPAGKAFSFGHPSVDVVARRFLSDAPLPSSCEPFVATATHKLNEEYAQLNGLLETERIRRAALAEALSAPRIGTNQPFWWNGEVDSMGLEELEVLRGQLIQLRISVAERANRLLVMQRQQQLLPFSAVGQGSLGENCLGLASASGIENQSGNSGCGGMTFCSIDTRMQPYIYGLLPPSSFQPSASGRFATTHHYGAYYASG